MLTLGGTGITVSATSLDEVVSQTQNEVVTQTPTEVTTPVVTEPTQQQVQTAPTVSSDADEFINEVKQATDLSQVSPGATKVNEGIKKIASFVVQILSYFVTAFLVVRVVVDLCYICIPFTRSFLANGYGGNAQAGAGGMGMQQPGMGGMGGMGSPMGGMGMGGMGMGGGMYGRGRYGMGGGMGMGMGGMGMGGMQGGMQGQPGANPAMGRTQWVSSAALNAVAAENILGPDGKSVSPIKEYSKDMVVILILTPILLTLAITGVLTDLGFLIGDMLTTAIGSIGGML
jgi:hypothetical protein